MSDRADELLRAWITAIDNHSQHKRLGHTQPETVPWLYEAEQAARAYLNEPINAGGMHSEAVSQAEPCRVTPGPASPSHAEPEKPVAWMRRFSDGSTDYTTDEAFARRRAGVGSWTVTPLYAAVPLREPTKAMMAAGSDYLPAGWKPTDAMTTLDDAARARITELAAAAYSVKANRLDLTELFRTAWIESTEAAAQKQAQPIAREIRNEIVAWWTDHHDNSLLFNRLMRLDATLAAEMTVALKSTGE